MRRNPFSSSAHPISPLTRGRWRRLALGCAALIFCLAAAAQARDVVRDEDFFHLGVDRQVECVVLLHGLWRTELSMKATEWKLEQEGFQVVNIGYPSLTRSIEENAVNAVQDGVAACAALGFEQFNFVTHSLGGILVRQYLAERDIDGLHRVVMMGPPNQGSELADYVTGFGLIRDLGPEAIEQLGTGDASIPLALGPVNFELGVIAGNAHRRNLLPGLPEGPGDGTVSVAETVVPGMLDFIEMPVSHTFMMWDSAVLEQVVHFLRFGRFDRGVS